MRSSSGETPRRYIVVESDRYDDDRDTHFLFVNRVLGPDYAKKWFVELGKTTDDLTKFPGPLSHTRDEEASARFGREVRRLLYYGPTRRRSGIPVRILFTVLPPDPDDPPETAESVILLLRLLHSSRPLSFEDAMDEEDKK